MKTAINVNPSKPSSIARQANRLLLINGYSNGDYNPHNVKVFYVRNEHLSCIAIGYHLQDAINNIVDCGLWGSLMLDSDTYASYENVGWTDSYINAGNASDAFWFENVLIEEL